MSPSNFGSTTYTESTTDSVVPFPDPSVTVQKQVVTRIPTLEGTMNVHLFQSSRDPLKEHMALVYGDLDELRKTTTLVRIHSECFTGEVLGSLRCDCREQLWNAQKQMAAVGGVIIYLRQEGRGIGLLEKLKAYNLQDKGYDTYDANVMLGHGADERKYDEAIFMLQELGITSVRLLTNNQEKIKMLRSGGINVEERIEMRPQIVTSDILVRCVNTF
jgi:GTP cyclohydrolase II